MAVKKTIFSACRLPNPGFSFATGNNRAGTKDMYDCSKTRYNLWQATLRMEPLDGLYRIGREAGRIQCCSPGLLQVSWDSLQLWLPLMICRWRSRLSRIGYICTYGTASRQLAHSTFRYLSTSLKRFTFAEIYETEILTHHSLN